LNIQASFCNHASKSPLQYCYYQSWKIQKKKTIQSLERFWLVGMRCDVINLWKLLVCC